MSRPTKCRMICRFPQTLEFIPAKDEAKKEAVILTLDEYETIRLIDKEGLSQEQCSQRMQVARTTAQKIYDSARKKLANVLVEGRPLKIEGGEYRLCGGINQSCRLEDCYKQEIHKTFQRQKGNNVTRIAVPYKDGQIFQHFGRTEQFKIYDVEDGKITSSEVVSTDGQSHAVLTEVLNALQTDVLTCDRIGSGARAALASLGIKLYDNVTGDADAAVAALISNAAHPPLHCQHPRELK